MLLKLCKKQVLGCPCDLTLPRIRERGGVNYGVYQMGLV